MLVHSFVKEYPSQTLIELIATKPNATILVPTLELYHEVRGTLTLLGSAITVTCLPPPTVKVVDYHFDSVSETMYSNEHRPYYITDANHEALINITEDVFHATYFFVRKL